MNGAGGSGDAGGIMVPGVPGGGPPIYEASFPGTLPHPQTKSVLSVVCGNSHYHWAIHEGYEVDFYPCLFWRTTHVQEGDYRQDPVEVMRRYLPTAAWDTLFGKGFGSSGKPGSSSDKDGDGSQGPVRFAAPKRCPIIPIYVVSTNAKSENGIRFLFSSIPNVMIYKILGNHFFTEEQGAYAGMGADRLAAARAAAYIAGTPTLVIDGGTALTYTAVDVNGGIVGGGISPGLQVQLSSLGEYTGALPSISNSIIDKAIEECKSEAKPLPLFAQDTERAILGSVLAEIAQHVSSIIKDWIHQAKPELDRALEGKEDGKKLNKKMKVLITGGDGERIAELLQPNHSNIVPLINDLPTGYELQLQKHLVHLGIQTLLCHHFVHPEKRSDDEKVRDAILGQRVAKTFNTRFRGDPMTYRGTVSAVTRGPEDKGLEEDEYTIVYDDSDREDVGLTELYDLLMYYHSKGETWTERESNRRKQLEKKMVQAKEAAEILAEKIVKVKESVAKRNAEKQKAKAAASAARSNKRATPASSGGSTDGNKLASGKKSKTGKKGKGAGPAYTGKDPAKEPNSVVGLRIAKYFQDNELYFGKIEDFYPQKDTDDKVDLWNVVYDDGDVEDFELDEVQNGLEIYAENKDKDPNAEE